jgi:DNA-binding NtrC family response regulator
MKELTNSDKYILQNISMLYIEDNDKIYKTILSLFKTSFKNNNIYHAKTTEEALSIFNNKDNGISFILSNLNNNERDDNNSFKFFEEIRKIDNEIPIILSTEKTI